MANVKENFVVTLQVNNYIYFDTINNQFKILKYQFKHLLEKPKIHSFSEIEKVKWLEMEDEKYCAKLEIMVKLKDNTKYYISFIKKPTSKKSMKYRSACKVADKIVSYLDFIQYARNISNSFTEDSKILIQ